MSFRAPVSPVSRPVVCARAFWGSRGRKVREEMRRELTCAPSHRSAPAAQRSPDTPPVRFEFALLGLLPHLVGLLLAVSW